ncbi:L-tyrosine/L-tryptophan isonitrile synthase family protein [Longispora albida]|uniref:L-tyrosine/L-tryptophan isonitrile synthase family protein n=1 Tax=Longispora albida TaxID=203523 RepID=UPI00036EC6D0|nr:L-tyrosine/L-tryptophan isonitrile synthase family protein [Longispora albida]
MPVSFADLVPADPVLALYCCAPAGNAPAAAVRPPGAPGDAGILVKVLRIAVDRHGVALPPLGQLGFTADGRLVLPPGTAPEATAATVQGWLRDLATWAPTAEPESGSDTEFESEIKAELRFLRPEIAGIFGHWGHSVSVAQHAVLADVLDRVAEQARRRRTDPALKRPAVMLDVDLCALAPRERTIGALRATGERHGIAEFTDPGSWREWPTYHPPAWQASTAALRAAYPLLDWEAVHADFCTAFFEPWERMRSDEPVAGLAEFAWAVFDAGGELVFNTGRRERLRAHTEAALARAGILQPRMAMMPDDRTRPVHEHKAGNIASFGDLHIVAVFDDLCENRQAIAKELPGVLPVATAIPGFAVEHEALAGPDDGATTITSFDFVPRTERTVPATARTALSDTLSIAELPMAELADHSAAAARHAIHLTESESAGLIRALVERSDTAAGRVAENAWRTHPGGDPVALLHHVLTRERFRKGPKANYPLALAERDLRPLTRRAQPIPVVTFGFPVKLHYNDLKTAGFQPDLAEAGALARLRELQRAARQVYPPGLAITVLTDGNHFQERPAALLSAYHGKLAEYHELVGGRDYFEMSDVEDVAERKLGIDVRARRVPLLAEHLRAINRALAGLDVTAGPVAALAEATRRCAELTGRRGDGTVMPAFDALFRSILYVVEVEPPAGYTRFTWSKLLYANILNVTGGPAEVRAARREVLRGAWEQTARYLAVLQVDRDLGYDDASLFPGRVRLTPNPRPGSAGFTYLGGAGVLPWHGTGAVTPLGQLSADFAVSLADRAYLPVYSPFLGSAQPWAMAPSREALSLIHLRRR